MPIPPKFIYIFLFLIILKPLKEFVLHDSSDLPPITCRELGIGIVAYSPLGRGFFAGKAVLESLPTESVLVCYMK